MTQVNISIGEDYIPDLARRMEKYRISRAMLARELGKDEGEISRWFNSKRRFGKQWTPRMSNIVKIESALINLRRRAGRAAPKGR